jgi:spermidine synthase
VELGNPRTFGTVAAGKRACILLCQGTQRERGTSVRCTVTEYAEPIEVSREASGPAIRWFFVFVVISGFCGLIYEVVWLRLAMASFGVTTALVSIVIAMFMAGLGLGSWGAGILTRRSRDPGTVLKTYATAELLVGLSSVLVPYELKAGNAFLQSVTGLAAWQSSSYYLLAGWWIAVALVPWCTAMGSTFPLLMAVIRQTDAARSDRSFSYLYLGNVAGALLGTLASAFVLIEVVGFTRTLYLAGLLNFTIATTALLFSARLQGTARRVVAAVQPQRQNLYGLPDWTVLCVLFTTGLTSMGMEVVWIRQFTPYLGNVVYAFAGIVAVYLIATVIGSHDYRSWICSHHLSESIPAWNLLALFALIPLFTADPLVPIRLGAAELGGVRLSGIVLFCALAGFLTPLLVDSWSGGDPDRAGAAYTVNIVGSILGPLIAGFVLLPHLGERRSLAILALPLFAIAGFTAFRKQSSLDVRLKAQMDPRFKFFLASVVAVLMFHFSHDYETRYGQREVKRDYTATVIGAGTGVNRTLLVNGFGMTRLTPVTKYMAHLPLAFMTRRPQNGLVICFGMGTTFRSMLTWGIRTTAVDLVPSVPAMFSYYHSDAQQVLRNPLGRIVIDDGRRFLEGSDTSYDVITIDPPPPPAAPGSSLLYSVEFYEAVKKHLQSDGIMQMWYPAVEGDATTLAAVTKSIQLSFPHLRMFPSFVDYGFHYLASMQPLPATPSSVLAGRMPPAAANDFVEWGPEKTPEREFDRLLSREMNVEQILAGHEPTPAIRDDEPVNEYYLLRDWFGFHR